MADIKSQTLSTIAEWQKFLQFLEGFSLDKEIDDEAERMRTVTEKLEATLKGSSASITPAASEAPEEVYDDTREPEVYDDTVVPANQSTPQTPVPQDDGLTYEISDDIAPKAAPKVEKKSSLTKKATKKHPKGSTSSAKDDESQSSGGSYKDMNESIPDLIWDTISKSKECQISGRLTKRSKPSGGGLFASNPKVYAGIFQNIFYYFDKPSSKKQKGAFRIAGYKCSVYVENDKKKKQKQKDFIFQMEAEGRPTYYFSTQTENPMNQWIQMFNKLAQAAIEEEAKMKADEDNNADQGEMEELYEEPDALKEDKVAEVGEMEDVYADPEDVSNDDKLISPPALPPSREDHQQPTPPPVQLRDKAVPRPGNEPESEIYDDGTSALPAPPTSWIEDDQEIYDEAESVARPGTSESEDKKQEPPKTSGAPLPKFETLFYGLWDCKGTTEHELEFSHGDKIEILERRYDKDGWWVGLLNGRVGLVPTSFLTPVYRKV